MLDLLIIKMRICHINRLLIASKLQRTGIQARGRIVGHDFTDSTDTLVLDISSAYDVAELKKLQRKFVYSRLVAGALSVTDEVAFSKPCDFGTALITFSQWKKLSDSSLMIYDQKEALHVQIEVTGADFEVEAESIEEDLGARRKPTRLGINLSHPVTGAVISLTISPN